MGMRSVVHGGGNVFGDVLGCVPMNAPYCVLRCVPVNALPVLPLMRSRA